MVTVVKFYIFIYIYFLLLIVRFDLVSRFVDFRFRLVGLYGCTFYWISYIFVLSLFTTVIMNYDTSILSLNPDLFKKRKSFFFYSLLGALTAFILYALFRIVISRLLCRITRFFAIMNYIFAMNSNNSFRCIYCISPSNCL